MVITQIILFFLKSLAIHPYSCASFINFSYSVIWIYYYFPCAYSKIRSFLSISTKLWTIQRINDILNFLVSTTIPKLMMGTKKKLSKYLPFDLLLYISSVTIGPRTLVDPAHPQTGSWFSSETGWRVLLFLALLFLYTLNISHLLMLYFFLFERKKEHIKLMNRVVVSPHL